MYMECSDNNRASTVYQAFIGAGNLPSRVLSDCGGENVMVVATWLKHVD